MKSTRPIKISEGLRAELEHWRFLESWDGCLPWKDEKHFIVNISSDASNSGWGGVLHTDNGTKEVRDYWSTEELSAPIAIKEARALKRTLLLFSGQIINSRVDARVDNTNLLHFWNNEGGRNKDLTEEIKSIFFLCLKLNITLKLSFIPSKNMPADAPSRFWSNVDCKLSEGPWRIVDKAFGPHTFDLMAIPSNVQKDIYGCNLKFFSPHQCIASSGVNVFAQSLPLNETFYVLSPFILIGPLLKFLRRFGLRITFLAYDISPRQFWWPLLNALAVGSLLIGK